MDRLILRAGAVLTLDDEGTFHQPGYVVVDDGIITEVAAGLPPSDVNVVDFWERLLMPGLINTHTHSPMSLFRGVAEGRSLLEFEGWYETIRHLEEILEPAWISPAVAVSCAEMIRTGTTTFADQYFFMDQIVPVVKQSGMRAALAYGIVELGDENARKRELAAAADFLESVRQEPMLTGWIGPHALFVDNSLQAIEEELKLAEGGAAGFHIHLSTVGEEDEFAQENFGCSAVAQMEALGVLDYRMLAAHCITLPEEDLPTLAAHPFTAVLCASAAMRSGVGAPPISAMRREGVDMAIGTDNVANNNSYDLFSEMRSLAKLASFAEKKPGAVSARQVIEMGTKGGARALGLGETIGSLESGKQADLIALDTSTVGWSPSSAQDIYTALVYSVSGFHVTDVMVAGRWVMSNQELRTIEYGKSAAALEQAYASLRDKAAAIVEA